MAFGGTVALALIALGSLFLAAPKQSSSTTTQTGTNSAPTLNIPNTPTTSNTPTTVPKTSTTPTTKTTTQTPPKSSGITMADVAKHASQSSCWSAINGKVYNLTAWINQHPGGSEAILSLCGSDGSAAFNDQHGGQRRPENELAGFYVGDLTP